MDRAEIEAGIAQLQPYAQKGLETLDVRPGSRFTVIGLLVAGLGFAALGLSGFFVELPTATMAAAALVALASFAGAAIIIWQRKKPYLLLTPAGLGLPDRPEILPWTHISRIEGVYKSNIAQAVLTIDAVQAFEARNLDKRFAFDPQSRSLRFGIGQSDNFKNGREFELALRRYWQGGQARSRIAELEEALKKA